MALDAPAVSPERRQPRKTDRRQRGAGRGEDILRQHLHRQVVKRGEHAVQEVLDQMPACMQRQPDGKQQVGDKRHALPQRIADPGPRRGQIDDPDRENGQCEVGKRRNIGGQEIEIFGVDTVPPVKQHPLINAVGDAENRQPAKRPADRQMHQRHRLQPHGKAHGEKCQAVDVQRGVQRNHWANLVGAVPV